MRLPSGHNLLGLAAWLIVALQGLQWLGVIEPLSAKTSQRADDHDTLVALVEKVKQLEQESNSRWDLVIRQLEILNTTRAAGVSGISGRRP